MASSGSDDDATAFDDSFADTENNNINDATSSYLPSYAHPYIRTSQNILPFGGSPLNRVTSKWKRKVANRCTAVQAGRASAKFLSSQLNEVASATLEDRAAHVATWVPKAKYVLATLVPQATCSMTTMSLLVTAVLQATMPPLATTPAEIIWQGCH